MSFGAGRRGHRKIQQNTTFYFDEDSALRDERMVQTKRSRLEQEKKRSELRFVPDAKKTLSATDFFFGKRKSGVPGDNFLSVEKTELPMRAAKSTLCTGAASSALLKTHENHHIENQTSISFVEKMIKNQLGRSSLKRKIEGGAHHYPQSQGQKSVYLSNEAPKASPLTTSGSAVESTGRSHIDKDKGYHYSVGTREHYASRRPSSTRNTSSRSWASSEEAGISEKRVIIPQESPQEWSLSRDLEDSDTDNDEEELHYMYPRLIESAKVVPDLKQEGDLFLDRDAEGMPGGRKEIYVPRSANAFLRGYQREGVKFLYKQFKNNTGGVLGDDMGLGKTVQVICFLAAIMGKTHTEKDHIHVKKRLRNGQTEAARPGCVGKPLSSAKYLHPVLIVLPASLVDQWARELEVWGHFGVSICRGSTAQAVLTEAEFSAHEIVLMTYEKLTSIVTRVASIEWAAMIFDEAHRLKNRKTKLGQAMMKLHKTKVKLALTGTPMQNDLDELWTFADTIREGCFGSKADFQNEYRAPVLQGRRRTATKTTLGRAHKAQERLSLIWNEMSLCRKKDIISEQLPQKDEKVIFCRMSRSQIETYARVLGMPDFQYILRAKDACSCGRPETRSKCCHRTCPHGIIWPRQHPDGLPCKYCPQCISLPCIAMLTNISCHLELLKPRPNEPEADRKYHEDFATLAFGGIPGSANPVTRFEDLASTEHCGKMRTLEKLLPEWRSRQNKVLIFTQYTRILDILKKFMDSKGVETLRLDGSTPSTSRLALCDKFNNDPKIFAFLISTKAGGVGLNLTGADRVVIFDPDWNPALDAQAQDRAYRIGQRKDVTVFRLVSTGSVEEMKYIRQLYKNQVNNVTLTGKAERRFFEGVAKDPSRKGKIFGIVNMMKLNPYGHLRTIRETGTLEVKCKLLKQDQASEFDIEKDDVSKHLKCTGQTQDESNDELRKGGIDETINSKELVGANEEEMKMMEEGRALVEREEIALNDGSRSHDDPTETTSTRPAVVQLPPGARMPGQGVWSSQKLEASIETAFSAHSVVNHAMKDMQAMQHARAKKALAFKKRNQKQLSKSENLIQQSTTSVAVAEKSGIIKKLAQANAVALGTLAIGVLYPDPNNRPSREEAVSIMTSAITDHNILLLDVADTYCADGSDLHYIETMVGEILYTLPQNLRSRVVVTTKGGMRRVGDGRSSATSWSTRHLTPTTLRETIQASRCALAGAMASIEPLPSLDIWMLHHANGYEPHSIEFEELLISMRSAVDEGEVKAVGLCNCSTAHIRKAKGILEYRFVVVSNSYSIFDRSPEKPCPTTRNRRVAKSNKFGVPALCASMGLIFLSYAPLGGLKLRDGRRDLVRSFPGLLPIARKYGITPHVLALAWLRAKFPGTLIPLVGMRSKAHLKDLGSVHTISISADDVADIDALRDSSTAQRSSLPRVEFTSSILRHLQILGPRIKAEGAVGLKSLYELHKSGTPTVSNPPVTSVNSQTLSFLPRDIKRHLDRLKSELVSNGALDETKLDTMMKRVESLRPASE